MSDITLIVVTPEATALDEKTSFVALPLYDGEIGVGRNHAPLIARLGYGELRIQRDGLPTRYYIDGGFVQIVENVVSVMTNRAIPSTELKADELQEQLEAARVKAAHSSDALDARDRAVAQARAQIRISQRGA